ncbi:MAG TPA: hypothetical protein VEA19_04175 [Actinomycetota bacterium]|nr:hypothetical protein [Actinomycetota bacterium]
MIRSKTALALCALLMVPMGSAWSGDQLNDPSALEHEGPGTPGIEKLGNIQHVAQVGGFAASDLEFASSEVVKLSNGATGDPVCEADPSQPDGCKRDAEGNVVFQKEVRDFAIAGGYGPPTRIIDITDPRNPVLVRVGPCSASQGDIQIGRYPSLGLDLLFVAQDGGTGSCTRPGASAATFNGTAVLDFSNPRNPVYLSRLQYTRGSHNQTAHPTKPFVYLSDSDLTPAGQIPIWNVSNPAAPVQVGTFAFGAHSPHDITFNADGSRAYAAAVSATYILNTEDPANPTLVSVIPNEGITISHQADPTPDGDFLLVSDEVGGGAAGASPGGPVYVYDIRNEVRPVRIGAIWDDCIGTSKVVCDSDPPSNAGTISTAHVFRINPDGYTMAIGWYHDGIHVIDFSDVFGLNPVGTGAVTGFAGRTIARMKMPNANNWSAKMWQEKHPGYVFSTDHGGRGFDVFFVSDLANGFFATGAIRAGNPGTGPAGGVTEHTFATVGGCAERPVNQGLDGYVYPNIPQKFADGQHEISLTVATGQAADLTIWFYDSSCGLMSTTPGTSGSLIPEGAKHIVVNGFTGAGVRFNTYIRKTA